jgi:hypothetical protein
MSDHAPSPDGTRAAGTLSIHPENGGCGRAHTAQVDDDMRAYYECDVCAPIAIAKLYGFAANPNGVPLTCDEQGERELAERDGVAMQRVVLRSITDHYMQQMTDTKALKAAAKTPSLAEQLATLTAAQKADLIRELGGAESKAEEPKAEAKTPRARTAR